MNIYPRFGSFGGRLRRPALLTILLAGFLAVGATVSGCSPSPENDLSPTDNAMMADHGLEGLDARQVIELLDTMPVADRPANLIASVRPTELALSDNQDREVSLPLPRDEFYLSVAPYVSRTHDCHFHSLTTCIGELSNAEVHVTVTDADTGEVLIDETRRTYDNGFIGLWLPRGLTTNLTLEVDGKSGVAPVSTAGDEVLTCLTTLQLS
ncbi:CueP family metal-binding protein [Enemella sp. A6]|uniref:CueP family metal-binding protein n=1 Tax=Enemella sp. A6 TaxID=3440152 RepID=UPI003EBDB3E7